VKRVDSGGRVQKLGVAAIVVVGVSWQRFINLGLALPGNPLRRLIEILPTCRLVGMPSEVLGTDQGGCGPTEVALPNSPSSFKPL